MKKGVIGLPVFLLLLGIISFVGAVDYNSTNNVIYRCGNITQAGNYSLNQSISEASTGANCINIYLSEGVNLNCRGFTINITANNAAIEITSDNITIRNCILYTGPTGKGIEISNSENSTIDNITATGMNRGLYVFATKDSLFSNITTSRNNYGVDLESTASTGNRFVNIISFNNTYHGIYIQSGNNNSFNNISTYNNSNDGISLYLPTNTTITNFYSNYNNINGIGFSNIPNSTTIINVTITNSQQGLFINGGHGVYVENFSAINITGNSGAIYSGSETTGLAFYNITMRNVYYGFQLWGNGSRIEDFNIENCTGGPGIYLLGGSSLNNISRGYLHNSTGILLYLTQSSDNIIRDIKFGEGRPIYLYDFGAYSNSNRNILINMSYSYNDPSTDEYVDSGSIFKKWYINAYANNGFVPISGANVSIYNQTQLVFNGLTGANGLITNYIALEYFRNSTDAIYGNNYTINASYQGINLTRNISLSSNSVVNLEFPAEETNISNCINITVPGLYALNRSIATSSGICINITANNVTLNFKGFNITGPGSSTFGYGVLIDSNNTAVKNGKIYSFWNGIAVGNGKTNKYNNVTNMTINSSSVGIYIYASSNSYFSLNNMTGNTDNLLLQNLLSPNSIFNNTLDPTNTIDGAKIYYNDSISDYTYDLSSAPNAGEVLCVGCNNVTIKDLTLNKNSYHGIFLSFTTNSTIQNVTLETNRYEIYSERGSENRFINNSIASSRSNGIFLFFESRDTIENNSITGSANGIYFWASSSNNITNNRFIMNQMLSTGLNLDVSSNNNIVSNTYFSMVETAIFSSGSSSNTFKDIIFGLLAMKYLNVTSSSTNNVLLNSSGDSTGEFLDSTSQLIKKWYLFATVTTSGGSAISSSNVSAYNSSSILQDSGLTDSSGAVQLKLIEYVKNGENTSYYSNYSINVNKSGYYANSTSRNITGINTSTVSFSLTAIPAAADEEEDAASDGGGGGGGGGGPEGNLTTIINNTNNSTLVNSPLSNQNSQNLDEKETPGNFLSGKTSSGILFIIGVVVVIALAAVIGGITFFRFRKKAKTLRYAVERR